MRTLLTIFLIFSFVACANSQIQTAGGIQTKEITYSSGGTQLKGYLAYDDSVKGKRPGVLVVHEWWGHNQHARDRGGPENQAARKIDRLSHISLGGWAGAIAQADRERNARKKLLDDVEGKMERGTTSCPMSTVVEVSSRGTGVN